MVAYVEAGEATLFSRRRNSLTERFATVAAALPRAVRTPSAVLDGEVVTLDETGRASFSAMQQGGAAQLLYVFDVLEADGVPLLDLPFTERRERARGAARPGQPHRAPVRGVRGRRGALRGREGAAARGDRLEAGRLPLRGREAQPGVAQGEGDRAPGVPHRRATRAARAVAPGTFGSLVLAVRDGDELRWVGNVGTGFGEKEIERLLGLLRPLERDTSPFPEPPKMPRVRARDVHWVEPRLVAEVEFVEWTHDGHLRAPSYVGLREDKAPEDVVREEPQQSKEEPRRSRRSSATDARRCGSRTSTSRSGRRRGSRRATCSRTTARSRRPSSRT